MTSGWGALLAAAMVGSCGGIVVVDGERRSDAAGGDEPQPQAASSTSSGPPECGDSPPDTWCNFAEAWFAAHCVSCHGPQGSVTPETDFSKYTNVSAHAGAIRCVFAPVPDTCPDMDLQTPYEPVEDTDRVIAWIESGFPEH